MISFFLISNCSAKYCAVLKALFALQNDSGSNPNWEQYDKDIENACLLPSLDHDQNNPQLINEKINHVYRLLMQKSKA